MEDNAATLIERYRVIRSATRALGARLSPEDCQIQSMADASPAKWHLAHTTWFFETFMLKPMLDGYREFDPDFSVLFNSYYMAVGERFDRPERGLLTRPSLEEVYSYREHVDAGMEHLLAQTSSRECFELAELGMHHEQQHQELLLMDIQHAFSRNPTDPVFDPAWPGAAAQCSPLWRTVEPGLYEIGHDGSGFAFDNECPRHRVWLDAFSIADSLVTEGDYLEFMNDGGYRRSELWLSDGWAHVQSRQQACPLYWQQSEKRWTRFSLQGRVAIDPKMPVAHVSYYEADAFARWKGCRLPTEAEWEVAARSMPLSHCTGAVWQWTASAYLPYPGYVLPEGAVGEYNGKFMVGQHVLRGGSFATPEGHARLTYRNFFPPASRWHFCGIRLAR